MLLSPLPEDALEGDRARRRALRCAVIALVATPLTVWLFLNFRPLLDSLDPLTGIARFLGTAVFGAVMSLTPVASLLGWVLALWFAVSSVYLPRERATPLADCAIVGLGVFVSFLPTLAFLGNAIRALVTGRVNFTKGVVYLLSNDPNAYWQAVGFMVMAAGVLAWLVWNFWRSKRRPPSPPQCGRPLEHRVHR